MHFFLDLITSLLKPLEHGLHFKNNKKLFFLFLIYRITNLYVRRISYMKFKNTKKIILFSISI